MTSATNWNYPLLHIQDGLAFYRGSLPTVNLHQHHAVELVVSQYACQFWNGANPLHEGQVALLGADVPHQFLGNGWQWFIYIEPESWLGIQLTQHVLLQQLVVSLPDSYMADLPIAEAETVEDLGRILDQLLQRILPNADLPKVASPFDDRIVRVLLHVKEYIINPLPISQLTDVACLSEGRLMHLFKEQIGIPIRKYILWNRLQVAVQHVLQGQNLTQAAHSGGFADSAHLSRTFSGMFGISPSDVLVK